MNNKKWQWLFGMAVVIALVTGALAARTVMQLHETREKLHLAELVSPLRNQISAATPQTDADFRRLLARKDAEIAELRRKLDDAERQLDEKEQQNRALAAPPSGAPAENQQPQRSSWLARIREQDPDRYAQIMEARERRRQAAEEAFQEQLDRLHDRWDAARSEEEANLIAQINDTLLRLHDLREKIRAATTDEQRREIGGELRDTWRELADLRARDRQMQLDQLAASIGYTDDASRAQFLSAVDQIIRETDLRSLRGSPTQPQP
jgi:hypothetical protein